MTMNVHYSSYQGAPYHFRACAKMVWGRSISAPPIKRAPDFSEALWGAARLFE